MESNTDSYILHSKMRVYIESLGTIYMVAILIYYSNGATKIPNEFQHNMVTNMLKIYLGFTWAAAICRIARLKSRLEFMNHRIRYELWQTHALEYMFPFKYYPNLMVISVGFEIYFVSLFMPINTKNCAVYGENKEVCDIFNTIVINILCWLGLYLLIILSACLFCIYIVNHRQNNDDTTIMTRVIDIAGFTRPVSVIASENTCTICLDDATQTDTQWAQLRCGHTFHPGCINHWLSLNPTCPTCRAVAVVNTDNNISVLLVQ